MTALARWMLVGTILMAAAFVAPALLFGAPAASGSLAVGGESLVFPAGHSSGSGGHGSHTSFTCPTVTGAGSSVCSTNWAGWADPTSNGAVTAVSGSWVVPSLSCPSRGTTYVAIWVGIDGYTSSTVEQTGVLGECYRGVAIYSAWYEFYPAGMVTFSGQSVAAGDSVAASVTYSSGTYTVSLAVNGGTPNTASATVSAAQGSSAEWIVERPSLCNANSCTVSTLANFGSTGFTSASATVSGSSGSISAASDSAITMVGGSRGPVLAQPSALDSTGSSFTVSYV